MADLSGWASLTSAMPAAELPSQEFPRQPHVIITYLVGLIVHLPNWNCSEAVDDGVLEIQNQLLGYDMWSRSQRFYYDKGQSMRRLTRIKAYGSSLAMGS